MSVAAVLLALIGALLGGPAVASAAQATLSVTVEGPGRVTGNGISCPDDCVDSETWRDDEPTPRRVLTATSGPGFRVEWTGCQVTANRPNECTATFDELGTDVTVRFVDIAPPTIAFSGRSRPDGVLLGPLSALPVYEVEAADNVGVARVAFRDAGTLYDTVVAAPWSAHPRPIAGRADGTYVFRATAFDAAGHSTSVERSIVYDGTAPSTAVTGGLDRHTRATSSSIAWSSTDAHPTAVGDAECGVRLRPEVTFTIVPCAQPLVVQHAVEGIWDVRITAKDQVGNRKSEVVEIDVDRTSPLAPLITSATPEGGVAGTRDSRVQLAPPAAEDPAGLTWNCWVDGLLIACPNGVATWTDPPGTTAVHFRATVSDPAGNESVSVERRWTIDEVPPAVTITQGPAEGAVVTEGDVTIAWSVPTRYDPHSRCSWHDEDITPCAQHRVTRRVTPGTYRLRLTVADVRQLETTIVRSFTVVAASPGGDPGPDPDPDPDPGPGGGGAPPGGPGLPPGLPGGSGLPSLPGGSPGAPSGGGSASVKRCVVPRVKRGAKVKTVQRQLATAGCKSRTKRVRSAKVKRGRVIKLSVKVGAKRPQGSVVTVQVSRGL